MTDTAGKQQPNPPTHGGARPGAGAPRGPRRATLERQAALLALFSPEERALFANIRPLDIIEAASHRFLANGRLFAAAQLAALAAPYHHHRKRVLVTDPAGLPVAAATAPAPLPGFGGATPEPPRRLSLENPADRDVIVNRIPRGARKGKRSAG